RGEQLLLVLLAHLVEVAVDRRGGLDEHEGRADGDDADDGHREDHPLGEGHGRGLHGGSLRRVGRHWGAGWGGMGNGGQADSRSAVAVARAMSRTRRRPVGSWPTPTRWARSTG